jgi:hypothetical protein
VVVLLLLQTNIFCQITLEQLYPPKNFESTQAKVKIFGTLKSSPEINSNGIEIPANSIITIPTGNLPVVFVSFYCFKLSGKVRFFLLCKSYKKSRPGVAFFVQKNDWLIYTLLFWLFQFYTFKKIILIGANAS